MITKRGRYSYQIFKTSKTSITFGALVLELLRLYSSDNFWIGAGFRGLTYVASTNNQ
jgi:hypothetical protein